jgi:hypothetical protein
MLNNTPATNVKLHLYNNNHTPAQSDVLSMYTESTAAGYSAFSLPGSSWTFATSAGTSSAAYAQQTFTFSTSDSLYGYYITDAGSSNLIFVEGFVGAPFAVPVGGGTIDVTPKINLL